jgi:outer membrane lipoprotein-sorting protein
MKQIHFIVLVLLSISAYTRPDPGAKKLLTKSESIYKNYKSIEIEYQIETKAAEDKAVIEKGLFQSSGIAFKLIGSQQEIYNDGKTQWTYLKKQKEIQITDYSSNNKNNIHPMQFLSMYKSGEYDYKFDNDLIEKGVTYQQVEFKPTDRNQDIFKIKIAFHKKQSTIYKVFLYFKNGDRSTIHFKTSRPNISIPENAFTLDPTKIPNTHVEDLRD